MNNTYVSIDLETLSLNPSNCPVVSLGAVAYSYTCGIFSEFEVFFDLDEQFKLGRLPSANTIHWWMNQSDDARRALTNSREFLYLEEGLDDFYEFWTQDVGLSVQDWPKNVGEDYYKSQPKVISMGFDLDIIRGLFPIVPWHYRNTRCLRSMLDWFNKDESVSWPENKLEHSALSDAKTQALMHIRLMDKFEQLR